MIAHSINKNSPLLADKRTLVVFARFRSNFFRANTMMLAPPTDDEGGGAYSDNPTPILRRWRRAPLGGAEFGRGGNLKMQTKQEPKEEKERLPHPPVRACRLP